MTMMNAEKTAPVKLPEICLGGHRIRYLYLRNNRDLLVSNKLLAESQTQTECIPLFLGSDVLTGIPQNSRNYPRIHTRFSKHGLATKLKLVDHRIADIANGREVWFYSVQGLYQAVFEYQSRQLMKECLIKLRELWLQRFDDSPLAVEIEVKEVGYENDSSAELESSETFAIAESAIDVQQYLVNSPSETLPNPQHGTDSFKEQHQVSQMVREYNGGLEIQQDLEQILCKVSQMLSLDWSSVQNRERFIALRDTLRFCLADLFRENFTWENCFPVCLLKGYTNIINDSYVLSCSDFENHFGIDVRRNMALCIISEYLGKEFQKLEDKISERVDSFKQSHIGQIDCLPTPQSLVSHLFPACMSCLLENWMGVHRTRYLSPDTEGACQSELSDHNYIHRPTPDLQNSDKEQDLIVQNYSFIQLILEFTNNCLISGVAHVLYSRLKDGMI